MFRFHSLEEGALSRQKRLVVVCHTLLHVAEALLFQRICKYCKEQPSCVILRYSNGPSRLSKRDVGQNGGIYPIDFLEMLHETVVRSLLQNEVGTCEKSGKKGLCCR